MIANNEIYSYVRTFLLWLLAMYFLVSVKDRRHSTKILALEQDLTCVNFYLPDPLYEFSKEAASSFGES